MAGRFTGNLANLSKLSWEEARRDLWEFLNSSAAAVNAVQSTPGDPTEIQAGVDADKGSGLPVALSNHIHDVSTGAPAGPVLLSGVSSEGSGSQLLRADSVNVLEVPVGASEGDSIVVDSGGTGYTVKKRHFTLQWTLFSPVGAVNIPVGFPDLLGTCRAISVSTYFSGGTSASFNARKNGSLALLSANHTNTVSGTWDTTAVDQNEDFAGDWLDLQLTAITGSPTVVAIQVLFEKVS